MPKAPTIHYAPNPIYGVSVCGQVCRAAGRGDASNIQSTPAATTCKLCQRWWRFPLPIPREPW